MHRLKRKIGSRNTKIIQRMDGEKVMAKGTEESDVTGNNLDYYYDRA